MIKVFQNIFGEEGNCQTAVLASLLEWPIEDVPHFSKGLTKDNGMTESQRTIEFNSRVDDFLEKLGYELLWYTPSKEIDIHIIENCKDIPYQVCGMSPRGYNHVVIYLNGEMVHDPHPDGGGVIPEYFGFINKLSH